MEVKQQEKRDTKRSLMIVVIFLIAIGCFSYLIKTREISNNKTQNQSTEENQAIIMQQTYNDFYGPLLENTNSIKYFEKLAGLGWDASSFKKVISNSSELAATKIQLLNSGRSQIVFLNIGVGEAQTPEYANTVLYRKDGQYGVIINLNLETSPAVKTPVDFWNRDYAFPVDHEMRHVKRFFESGLFDGHQINNDLDSNTLYQEYLKSLLTKYKLPIDFNSISTVENIDELGVVLETDNPKEIALNIDRLLNNVTVNTLINDESLGVIEIVPIYLEQIVLARNLSKVYEKDSVKQQNYPIDNDAFNQLDVQSKSLEKELYKAYPDYIESMQKLEKIYGEEANKAIMENA